MRKLTHYKVSGVLETKPTNLPEGLTIEEVEVTMPTETVNIRAIHGGSSVLITEYDLSKSSHENPGIMIPGKGIFEGAEVRKLRDFCNKVLGENPGKMRVLEDSSGDWWFELVPGLFTFGSKYVQGKTALQDARTNRELNDGRYIDWTEQRLRDAYDYVGDITNTWEN